MSSIAIESLDVEADTLRCTVRASGDCERFLSGEPFRTSYGRSIESVPEGVLAVPVLAQICPVAWACGADVYVPEVDAAFARALEDAKAALLGMHDFMVGGRLHAERRVDYDSPKSGASGLLFTGGVDSTASYVRHREEEPILVSVRGWTVTPEERDDEKWAALCDRVSEFASERGLGTAFVESNMLRFLDHPMLLAHYKRHVDGAWYSSVGHGLGLTGLCAPLAYAAGMDDLYVAATHWEGIDLAWGSRPDVDDHVRWSGTQCHHDGYGLTRQERLDLIADYVRSECAGLRLQTCNDRMDGNCGRCEKCYRTAVGLRLSGLDPNEHGYRFVDEDYREIRAAFERDEWVLGQDERHMWEDIRRRARETEPRTPAERAFFDWLDEADLDALVDDSAPPLSHRLLRAGARTTPNGVYRTLYPVWKRANEVGRRLARSR
ncbi:hypothetical protein [Halovivax sp.]|uniref:hypothetical protein n=1 Tax=Halovivax sp. TaxID=1935978 RepID=UPI0025BE641C|nr:hypothetical protein [Halovivax sp.]